MSLMPLISVASSQDYFSGQPGYEKAASIGDSLSFIGLGTSVTLSKRKSIRSYLLADSNLTPRPEKLQERGILESRTTTKSDHIPIETAFAKF